MIKSFKEYISEQPEVTAVKAPTNTNQTQASEDEGGPTEKDVCEWFIIIWDIMGCVGRDDDTDTGNFDCDSWEELMRIYGCGPSKGPMPMKSTDKPKLGLNPSNPSRVPKI